jgi:hypothetical protein
MVADIVKQKMKLNLHNNIKSKYLKIWRGEYSNPRINVQFASFFTSFLNSGKCHRSQLEKERRQVRKIAGLTLGDSLL